VQVEVQKTQSQRYSGGRIFWRGAQDLTHQKQKSPAGLFKTTYASMAEYAIYLR